jgi:hypothetical protein
MEDAALIGTCLGKVQENLGTMNAYTVEARSHPRFKLEVDISINSRTCGRLKGYTVDISESGIAAMLTLEVPLGEILELDFMLPSGPVMILAMVRERNAFRYGFEFVDSTAVLDVIRRTCRDLAVDQSLLLLILPTLQTDACRAASTPKQQVDRRPSSCFPAMTSIFMEVAGLAGGHHYSVVLKPLPLNRSHRHSGQRAPIYSPQVQDKGKTQHCPHGCHGHLSDPGLQGLGHWPAHWLSAMFGAGVIQHRLRRLRAATPVPVVELVDPLDVRAHFAFQDHTTGFAT